MELLAIRGPKTANLCFKNFSPFVQCTSPYSISLCLSHTPTHFPIHWFPNPVPWLQVICQRTELENLKMSNQNWGDVIFDSSNWSVLNYNCAFAEKGLANHSTLTYWSRNGTERNTRKTRNSYVSPHCSVWSPWAAYHWTSSVGWTSSIQSYTARGDHTQLVEIRHCSENLHSCSVFSECSVPFRKIMTPRPLETPLWHKWLTCNIHSLKPVLVRLLGQSSKENTYDYVRRGQFACRTCFRTPLRTSMPYGFMHWVMTRCSFY